MEGILADLSVIIIVPAGLAIARMYIGWDEEAAQSREVKVHTEGLHSPLN